MNAKLCGRRRIERGAWLVLVATGLLVAGCITGAPPGALPPPTEPATAAAEAGAAPPAIHDASVVAPIRFRPLTSAAATSAAPLAPLPQPLVVRVVRGDTMWGIARRYHVRLATLVAVNPQIHDPRLIHAGDRVWVPREAMNVTSSGRTTSGTLVLGESTTLKADHHGNIVIQADGVTLDCGGHRVYGPGLGSFSGGIDIANADDVTVRRCVVTGFVHNGLFGHHGAGLRLEGNTFVGNGNHGVHLDAVTSSAVMGNTSRLNGVRDPAIGMVATKSTGVAITGNVVSGNPWAGVALLDGTTSSTVESNLASLNGTAFLVESSDGNALTANTAAGNRDGFALLGSSGTRVSANTASRNSHCGFCLDRGTSRATLAGNASNGNYDGFGIHASNANALNGNIANANRHYGFVAFGGASDNVLSHNTALRSGSYDAWEEGTGSGDVWSENVFRTTSGL